MHKIMVISGSLFFSSFMILAVGDNNAVDVDSLIEKFKNYHPPKEGLKRKLDIFSPNISEEPPQKKQRLEMTRPFEFVREAYEEFAINDNTLQLTDAQWEYCKEILRKESLLKGEDKTRKFIEQVYKKITTRQAWPKSVNRRFHDWNDRGIWLELSNQLSQIPDSNEVFSIIAQFSNDIKERKKVANESKIAIAQVPSKYHQLAASLLTKVPQEVKLAIQRAKNGMPVAGFFTAVLFKFGENRHWTDFLEDNLSARFYGWRDKGRWIEIAKHIQESSDASSEESKQLLAIFACINAKENMGKDVDEL